MTKKITLDQGYDPTGVNSSPMVSPLESAVQAFVTNNQDNNPQPDPNNIQTAEIGPSGTHILVNNPNNGWANQAQGFLAGAGKQYIQGQTQQRRQQFIQGVHQIMSSPNQTQQDRMNALMDLQAQHGTDYGIGLNDMADKLGLTKQQPLSMAEQIKQLQSALQTGQINSDQAHQQALKIDPNYQQTQPALADAVNQSAQQSLRQQIQPIIDKTYGPGYEPNMQFFVGENAGKGEMGQLIDTDKATAHQDNLMKQAQQAIVSVRGDTSLQRTENQRDAAISAYNTLQNVSSQGRLPSQIEYYDLLGQLWKARTGVAPTDQAIRDLDAKTFQGNLGKVSQFFTGQPVATTTQGVVNNLKDFVQQTGEQSDALHDGYMKSRLIKPQGLNDDTWNQITSSARGMSFKEATENPPLTGQPQANGQPQEQPNNGQKDYSSLWN